MKTTAVTTLILLATLLLGGSAAADEAFQTQLGATAHDLLHDPKQGLIYISLPEQDQIAVLSDDTFEQVDTIKIGRDPRGIAIDRNGTHLFVALAEAKAVAVINVETGETTKIRLREPLNEGVPWDLAFVPDGRLYVISEPKAKMSYVVEVQPANDYFRYGFSGGDFIKSRAASEQITLIPTDIALSKDGHYLYVSEDRDTRSIRRLDLHQEGAPTIQVDQEGEVKGIRDLTVSPDGYLLHTDNGQVLHAGSLTEYATVSKGLTRYGQVRVSSLPPPSRVYGLFYVASVVNVSDEEAMIRVKAYENITFRELDEWELPCPATPNSELTDFMVLPYDQGFAVLVGDSLCGLITDTRVSDSDGDSIPTDADNCPDIGYRQWDRDGDGLGNGCDPYPDAADNLQACLMEVDELSPALLSLGSQLRHREFDIQRLLILDSDWDRVPNARDACPGTSNRNTVDQYGCSPEQLAAMDEDGDKVPNPMDLCENTRFPKKANALGCSPGQIDALDLDGDGVVAPLDACHGTAPNRPVDAYGCANYQLR